MNRIVRFLEDHVEKIVLVVVGIISLLLLFVFVVRSPNRVEIDGRELSPSEIDKYVYEQARDLRREIGEPDSKAEPYDPRLPQFAKLLESALDDINVQVAKGTAPTVDESTFAQGVYRIPEIGDVSEVKMNHIRAVAYIPVEEVTGENTYDDVENEPNDLDLVSVEAKFDVEKLYESFKDCFYDNVEQVYADPCLAKPIFAKVQLQRQKLNDDGTWSEWEEVPRPRIDHNKELFNIGDRVGELPTGGLDVLKVQYGYKQTQIDLLQPMAYQFASAREEWFPPSLHDEYAEFQRKERAEELRKEKEERREARMQEREGRSGRRSGTDTYGAGGGLRGRRPGGSDSYRGGITGGNYSRNRGRNRSDRSTTGLPGETGRSRGGRRRGSSRRSTADPMMDNMYGPGGMEGVYGGLGTTQRGPRRETINDVYRKYDEIALSRLTDFTKIREPLLLWAHDDTVEPGNTYRYRIRLGVLNPVAGTNKLDERDKSYADQAILWSDFSEITKPVDIMDRIYFFANDVREADKSVTVQVSRLTLGHWYSEEFPVKQGVLIGESREYEPEEEPDRRSRTAGGFNDPAAAMIGGLGPGVGRATGPGVPTRMSAFGTSQDTSNIPEYIDYSTGAVMVDAVAVSDWATSGRTMRSRQYYDMLYSYDGIDILHMPVGRSYWPKDTKEIYSKISRLENVEQEPFKSFGSGASRRRGPQYDDMGGYEEMMYEDMGGYENMGLY
jgi:hypothetical protein